MIPKHVMDKIKSMITKDPSVVKEVDYKVSNYQEVVKYWTDYKKNPDNVSDYFLKNLFEFHKNKTDHAIMFYCCDLKECIIMAQSNGVYINLIIPTQNIGDFPCDNKSFVATFCES